MSPAEVVDALVKRPAMYFGNRPGYLREMIAFQLGADFGLDGVKKSESVIPEAFVRFICARVPAGKFLGPSWSGRLEDATHSEEEAWELFVRLWTEFRDGEQVA